MLDVTITLYPNGDRRKPRHMGTATIVNIGNGTMQKGNYAVRLSKWGNPSSTWRLGTVNGFPRQEMGPWDLLYWCLTSAVGMRTSKLLIANCAVDSFFSELQRAYEQLATLAADCPDEAMSHGLSEVKDALLGLLAVSGGEEGGTGEF